MFHVGQKVVCVDNSGTPSQQRALKIGGVYTVLALGGALIRTPDFIRVDAWEGSYGRSNGWRADRFRPVTEKKSDISIFTKMLTPKRKELVPSVTEDRVRDRSPILNQT